MSYNSCFLLVTCRVFPEEIVYQGYQGNLVAEVFLENL